MIAKAHTNDYMQGQLTARIITAMTRGEATPTIPDPLSLEPELLHEFLDSAHLPQALPRRPVT